MSSRLDLNKKSIRITRKDFVGQEVIVDRGPYVKFHIHSIHMSFGQATNFSLMGGNSNGVILTRSFGTGSQLDITNADLFGGDGKLIMRSTNSGNINGVITYSEENRGGEQSGPSTYND